MRRLVCAAWTISLVACSGEGSPPKLEAHARCAAVDMLEFDPVQIAQTATRLVYFTNAGDSDAKGLSTEIAGPDAAAFTATADSSSVSIGGVSIVTVAVAGTGTIGDKHATLEFGDVTIPLVAHEVAATTGLLVTSSNIEFISEGENFSTQLQLSNQGTTTLVAQGVTADVDALAAYAYYHYVTMIPPAGQAQVNVDASVATGCGAGVLHLHTDQGSVDVPISGEYLPVTSVAIAGDGSGTVTSDPPAISCGTDGGTCSALAPSATFTLTATPKDGDHFNGWDDPRCGLNPVCEVTTSVGAGLGLTATFAAAEDVPIELQVAGAGAGSVVGGAAPCTGSCTFYVPGGGLGAVELTAKAFSQFAGWSGDCTTTDATCGLSVLTGGRTVTATFNPDPHEVSSRLLPLHGRPSPMPNGDFVSSANLRVVRFSPSDDVVWAHPLLYATQGLITTPGGITYFQDVLGVSALGPDGKLLSTVPAAPGMDRIVAVFGEDVVISSPNSVKVYADGSLKWQAALNASAFASTANQLAIAAGDVIHRYGTDGTEVLPTWTAPAGVYSMSYAPAGKLVVLTAAATNGGSISSPATLCRFSTNGSLDFSVQTDSSDATGSGQVLALPDGNIAALRIHYRAYGSALDLVELYDTTGTRLWSVRKGIGWTSGDSYFPFGFQGQLLANPSGGFWVAGEYLQSTEVLETFAP